MSGADHRIVLATRSLGKLHELHPLFADAGIAVEWFNYDGYPEYPQLHGAYESAVSVLDLLLMNGPASPGFALRGEAAVRDPGGDGE